MGEPTAFRILETLFYVNKDHPQYDIVYVSGRPIRIGKWEDDFDQTHAEDFARLFVINENYANLFVDRLEKFDRIKNVLIEYDQPNVNPIVKISDLTQRKTEQLRCLIKGLEESGHLRRSQSQWSSPAYPSNAKGKMDINVDYNDLNNALFYSGELRSKVPKIKDVLRSITQSYLFSKIVVKDGFHQISLGDHSAKVMAFQTGSGTFEFTTLHDGMKDATHILQGVMEHVLANIHDEFKKFIRIYEGQILVFTESSEDHSYLLEKIMHCFAVHNVKIDLEESLFLAEEVTYLGSVINEEGRSINPTEIRKFHQFEEPRTLKDVRSFLGLVGYHKEHIEDFDYLTEPLRELIGNDPEFYWEIDERNAFYALKERAIKSNPIPLKPLEN